MFDEEVLRFEAELIRAALVQSGGQITQAARLLGISHQRLSAMLTGRHQSLMPQRKPKQTRRLRRVIFDVHLPVRCVAKRELSAQELPQFAASVLPVNLPAEIREEAQSAIVVDLLTRQIEAEALEDARIVRRYVRAAYGFQDGYKFRSLDAPVNDGETTLGELIAA